MSLNTTDDLVRVQVADLEPGMRVKLPLQDQWGWVTHVGPYLPGSDWWIVGNDVSTFSCSRRHMVSVIDGYVR